MPFESIAGVGSVKDSEKPDADGNYILSSTAAYAVWLVAD